MVRPLLLFSLLTTAALADKPVSFRTDVAPLLHRRCARCHDEDSAKGRYRLDSLVRVWKTGESDLPPVVAGKPGESELYLRLVETAPDERMPQKADALPAAEVAIVSGGFARGRWAMVATRIARSWNSHVIRCCTRLPNITRARSR